MSWYVPFAENIKKRACRYLLQRYLGQYLEEKLTLDQLTVDLFKGTGSVSDVTLDCQVEYWSYSRLKVYVFNLIFFKILAITPVLKYSCNNG